MHPAARVLRQSAIRASNNDKETLASSRNVEDRSSSGNEDDGELFCDAASEVAAATGASPVSVNAIYSRKDVDTMIKDMERLFKVRLREKEICWEKTKQDQLALIAATADEADRLREKCSCLKNIVTEYERSMIELVAERDGRCDGGGAPPLRGGSESELGKMALERDQLAVDLCGVEASFADLHRRYEKVKESVEGYRKNEELLKQSVLEHRTALEHAERRYGELRRSWEERLSAVNDEMESVRRSASADVARLQAAQKKSELRVHSLEMQLEHKTQECAELTTICDELIAKLGGDSK